MECLKIENLSLTYDGKTSLSQINLSIPEHCITAIIGPSGCGKTSLLQCINGLIHDVPGAAMLGQVFLCGVDTATLSPGELRKRVGLVFQTPAPFPFSIYRNMTYALKYYGVRNRSALDAAVVDKLKLAGLYDEVKGDLNRSALKLSGGQQQRLCIARALTADPELLLLDEPCSALDVKSSAVVEDLLLRLKERYTIIIVTHNIAQARRVADRVVFLYEGRVVETGVAEAVLTHPEQPETQGFLQGVFG